jgi:hypothetical protein
MKRRPVDDTERISRISQDAKSVSVSAFGRVDVNTPISASPPRGDLPKNSSRHTLSKFPCKQETRAFNNLPNPRFRGDFARGHFQKSPGLGALHSITVIDAPSQGLDEDTPHNNLTALRARAPVCIGTAGGPPRLVNEQAHAFSEKFLNR